MASDGTWACQALDLPSANALAQADLQCEPGQTVAFDGAAWACVSVSAAAGGDITAVQTLAGSGLQGGAEQGEVTLAVRFEGNGAADAVARSDHTHTFGSLEGMPTGFADRRDDDALGELECTTGQVPSFDQTSGWACRTLTVSEGGVEVDPTVNDLARSAALDACGAQEVPMMVAGHWQCGLPLSSDTLAALGPCADGQVVRWSTAAGGWTCGTVGGTASQDILPGPGITVSEAGGDVTVSADFGGACASNTVACREHDHPELVQDFASVLTAGNSAGGSRLADLAPPLYPSDAVTKAYVDALGTSGGGGLALVLCCGGLCPASLPGWSCDDVNSQGSLTLAVPSLGGFLTVPDSGSPVYRSPGGARTVLNECTEEWFVCSTVGVSQVVLSCGAFQTSPSPSPYTCGVPGRSYIFAPGTTGPLFLDGTDAANEMLTSTATTYQPRELVDCSGAPALPNGARTAVCWR